MGDYRPIIPSGWQAASKQIGSAGNNDSGSGSPGGGRGSDNSRRRRTGGSITQLACTECRKARAKCDGGRPDVCSRCQTRGLQCAYEPHTKTQKDELIQQLQTVRAREETVLRENRDYSIILDILTNNGHVDEVIKRLRTGDTPDTIVKWLSEKKELISFVRRNGQDQSSLLSAVHRVESMYAQRDNQALVDPAMKQWTTVTSNFQLVRQLLDLYFTWMHPHHMLFSETSFLDHFVQGEEGHASYCSAALVNAICAMACNILLPPETSMEDVREVDRTDLQRAFLNEARAGLTSANRLWLTSLQAFAVMFLVEISAGRARVASSYLRFAADNLPSQVQDSYKPEVWEASRWGIHTLNTVWCAFTYQKPFNPQPQSAQISLKLNDNLDWGAYSFSAGENPRRPSFAILTATSYANLFRIVHRTITLYCGASGKVSAKAFLKRHEEFLTWKSSLPSELQLDGTAGGIRPEASGPFLGATQADAQLPLPHVISLHLQYYTAMVELFLPLFHCQNLSVEFRNGVLTSILENARKGLRILQPAAKKGLCRWYMPMTIHAVLHLCDTLARHAPDFTEKREAVVLCTNILSENRRSFKISGPLLQMFRESMKDYDPELSKVIDSIYGPEDQYGMDDLLEACTRLTYAQPTSQIIRIIDTSFEDQWDAEINNPSDTAPPSHFSRHSMRLDDVLNTN